MKGWLVLGVLLAGCGGSTAASQPSPTPNLGAEYTRIVAPVNASLDALDAAIRATPQNNAGIRSAAAAPQAADAKFNVGLLTLRDEAPAGIRADIDSLRKAVAQEESLFGAIVNSTDANLVAAVLAANNFSDGGASSLVRSDLGLSPPPNSSPSP